MPQFFRSLFLTPRFFIALGGVTVLFLLGYFFPLVFWMGMIGLGTLGVLAVLDVWLLWKVKRGVFARRETPERLSNGDLNELILHLESFYAFPVSLRILDELPYQFQQRDLAFETTLAPREQQVLTYSLRPVERGEYEFGAVNLYASSPLRLLRRRFRYDQQVTLPVYPSFLQMRQYELMALSSRQAATGIKKIRKIGQSQEFEQIREYVSGDDVRTLNWKATARHGTYMVNQFQDQRSQPVYCVIDTGRLMKSPFEGLSLLDHAINSALVISNIVLRKSDKAGLITFADRMGTVVAADQRPAQRFRLLEALYNLKTNYLESDFERLYSHIRRQLPRRSLLLLFTNFETLSALRRQLPYLRRLSRDHLLVVIFFLNTELQSLEETPAHNTEEIYVKTIAEKFAFEKRQIVKELERHGIQSILTPPSELSVHTINKYLELKARGMI